MTAYEDEVQRTTQQLVAEMRSRFPEVTTKKNATAADQEAVALGRDGHGVVVALPRRARGEHMMAIGTTGGGKTNGLAQMIRQDIVADCGVLLIDPHGEHPDSIYRTTLAWLDRTGLATRRHVHLVDLNATTHSVAFNPLALPPDTDVSVISGGTLDAFLRAWPGQQTGPTTERVLTVTFATLAELGLTLVEAPLLLDRKDSARLRSYAINHVRDRYTKVELQRLHELSQDDRRRQDFDLEVLGPMNRLARFLRPTAIRAMIGQTERMLDLREAMDEGHVVLANLSGGSRVYERDADLLGRLLTRALFFHAKRRRCLKRPFYFYADECHRYLSGDLESVLAEIRKYSVSTCLSFQWLAQMQVESDNMLAAVRNATNIKLVFRIKDPQEAEDLARAVLPLNLEVPVKALVKPAVVGHRRTRLSNESTSEQVGTTMGRAHTSGRSESYSFSEGGSSSISRGTSESFAEMDGWNSVHSYAEASGWNLGSSETGTESFDAPIGLFASPQLLGTSSARGISSGQSGSFTRGSAAGTSGSSSRSAGTSETVTESTNWSEAVSHGTSEAVTESESVSEVKGQSRGSAEALESIYADLPGSVHSMQNALYMAAQTLRTLKTGEAVLNYVGAHGMISAKVFVPKVSDIVLSQKAFDLLRERMLNASPSAVPMARALDAIARREHTLLANRETATAPEPASFRAPAPPQTRIRDRPRPATGGRRRPAPEAKHRESGR